MDALTEATDSKPPRLRAAHGQLDDGHKVGISICGEGVPARDDPRRHRRGDALRPDPPPPRRRRLPGHRRRQRRSRAHRRPRPQGLDVGRLRRPPRPGARPPRHRAGGVRRATRWADASWSTSPPAGPTGHRRAPHQRRHRRDVGQADRRRPDGAGRCSRSRSGLLVTDTAISALQGRREMGSLARLAAPSLLDRVRSAPSLPGALYAISPGRRLDRDPPVTGRQPAFRSSSSRAIGISPSGTRTPGRRPTRPAGTLVRVEGGLHSWLLENADTLPAIVGSLLDGVARRGARSTGPRRSTAATAPRPSPSPSTGRGRSRTSSSPATDSASTAEHGTNPSGTPGQFCAIVGV